MESQTLDVKNTIDTIIQDSKEWSKSNADILRNTRHPFTNNESPKITRKAFLTYRGELITLFENNNAAAAVIGELRGLERIMRYFENTAIFKDHPDRAEFHADMLQLLKGIADSVKKEYGCITNVTEKYADKRVWDYQKTFHPKFGTAMDFTVETMKRALNMFVDEYIETNTFNNEESRGILHKFTNYSSKNMKLDNPSLKTIISNLRDCFDTFHVEEHMKYPTQLAEADIHGLIMFISEGNSETVGKITEEFLKNQENHQTESPVVL